jgi:hypothetical protein
VVTVRHGGGDVDEAMFRRHDSVVPVSDRFAGLSVYAPLV